MEETITDFAEIEALLNDFDPQIRLRALDELAKLAEAGRIPPVPEREVANMHCHSFFSFNAHGHSPTSLAWQAKRRGIKLMGVVDFDVLDGVDEFLTACERLSLRGSAGLETRVYLPEFASREINSPGEPGIYYHMGVGFPSGQIAETAAPILQDLRQRSNRRNRQVVDRVNAYLDPVTIDYERDVISLTPSGNATERHIVQAFVRTAQKVVSNLGAYWAAKLDLPLNKVKEMIGDPPEFQNTIRSRLIKRGGIGYIQPSPEMFPTVEPFHQLIQACGALPCATWLDGTSQGEQAMEELLGLLIRRGAVALNIIPDRNWDIPDPDVRRVKIQNLYRVVQLAQELALPLNVGTELNTFGQKWVDDYDVPELAPVRRAFLDGAHFVFGHTLLERALGMGYQSAWAREHLSDRRQRNEFFTEVGYRIPPGRAGLDKLKAVKPGMTPQEVLHGG